MPGRSQYTDLSATDPLTGETWRFSVHQNGSETVIQRGRAYQLLSDWSWDSWARYWDDDQMVAVYDDVRNYTSPTRASNPEDTERVEHALKMAEEYDQDPDEVLTRLARRLFNSWGMVRWDARFIPVGVDRGVTLYALSYDGDPEGTWRDEIEAVYHGDIWRIEVEEYVPWGGGEGEWQPTDEVCNEWYGEDVAQAAFEKEFPLAEFPADLTITNSE